MRAPESGRDVSLSTVPGLPRSALMVLSLLQVGAGPGPSLAPPWLSSSACPAALCEHPANKPAMGTQLCSCTPACQTRGPRAPFPVQPRLPAAPGTLQQAPPSPGSLSTCSPLRPPRPGEPQWPRWPLRQGSSGSGQSQGGLLRAGTGNPGPGRCPSAGHRALGRSAGRWVLGGWGKEETKPRLQQRTFMGSGLACFG